MSADPPKPDLYSSPAVQQPSIDEITKLSADLNLNCSSDEVEAFYNQYKKTFQTYQKVYNYPSPELPVKYPRTPGHREREDNAWYWRCDISGADTGLLAGKTVAIKDSIAVAGVPMMHGSKLLEGYTPEFDATVVTKVLDAGGRITGKAACDDMCLSDGSWSSSTGPIGNPLDKSRNAGGSSSGCASLVARGLVDMAIGADQGGSVRNPASFCGLVGLKPTFGLIPYTGSMTGAITIDHLGPMTRTVEDCAHLLEAISGYDDGNDPRQTSDIVVPSFSKLYHVGISGKTVGILKEGFEGVDKEVSDCVLYTVNRLQSEGAIIKEVSVPTHKFGSDVFCPLTVEGSYACAGKGGTGYLWRGFYPLSLQEAITRGYNLRPFDLPIHLKMRWILGEYLQNKYQNKFYAKAQNLVPVIQKGYDDVLKDVDVLVMPTMPATAGKLPTVDSSATERLQACLVPSDNLGCFNVSGHPALSINAGYSQDLPVGLSIVGKRFDDLTVLQVGYAVEQIR